MEEVEEVFGGTQERKDILVGWLNFRAALRATGIPLERGFMWLDGSFCEELDGREPRDLDLVAFLPLPTDEQVAEMGEAQRVLGWEQLMSFFDQEQRDKDNEESVWRRYRCDAYNVLLDLDPELLLQEVLYWYGLFSHRRDTMEWKGM
jgi:hypothetical protein